MSDVALGVGRRRRGIRGTLARLGFSARRRARFALMLAALTWGVIREAARPSSWRRTVRAEFGRALRQAVSGGVMPVLVTAALIGIAMVSQALYWIEESGQSALLGPVIVTVLMREIAPVLVGLILLGRSGMVAVSEIGALQLGGQVRALEAQGLDPFQILLLPRATALALASFTLGMVFVVASLLTGFMVGSVVGAVKLSLFSFLDSVLLALHPPDFVALPAKLMLIGLLVALSAGLTGLTARPRDDAATLLPRGFVRGVLAVLFASIVLSLVV
ncbi:MAG: ABC transporter permease [Alphaproteobacteria bacterium]|nr:ABC transporter permease [Alphaproteobacteria bacterium]